MRRRIAPLLSLLVVTALISLVPAGSLAASGDPPIPLIIDDPLTQTGAPSGEPAGRLTVMLELATPLPDAAAPASEAADQLAKIARSQEDLSGRLAALGVPVLFQTRAAYSGIAVSADASQLDELRALPGVSSVHVITPKDRAPSSTVAVTGAASFWSATHLAGGEPVLGADVRVGVIGSGVDYTHATFGGPGTPAAYSANNPAVVEAGSFPTGKVTAGVDFVGDAYNAASSDPAAAPLRDADPLDCSGDGTHMASVAAGFGVDPSGATYRGIYSSSVSFDTFKVGPGIAPAAGIVALKIFGCHGSTTFLTKAIDYAIDPNGDGGTADRLVDVLMIALGSPFGGADDPDVAAVDRAVRAGVVVVVSVGDSGNTFYATSSPASAPLAIAVGASVSEVGASASSPAGTLLPTSARGPAQGGTMKPDLVAPGAQIPGAKAGSGNGAAAMTGTAAAVPQVAGAVALLRELHPSWEPSRIKHALVGGADPLRLPDGTLYPPSLSGGGNLELPSLAAQGLLAYPAGTAGDAALAFGTPWVSQPLSAQRQLTVENIGDAARTVRLSTVAGALEAGVQVEVPAGPYTLQPGQSLQVPVSLSVQPQLLDNTPDAATPAQQGAFGRYYLAEHGGFVQLVSTLGARVRGAHAANIGDVLFYVGGTQVAGPLSPGRDTKYRAVAPGLQTVRVADASSGATLLTQQVDLRDGHDYTLTVWGRSGSLRLTPLDEIPAVASEAVAQMHFFNGDAFGDGSAVDAYIDGTLSVSGLAVGSLSPYLPVAGGTHYYRVVRAGAAYSSSPVASRTFSVGGGQLFTLGVGACQEWSRRSFVASGRLQNEQVQHVPFQIFPKAAAESSATPAVIPPADATAVAVPLQNTGARNGLPSSLPAGAQLPLVSAFALEDSGASPQIAALAQSLRPADIQYVGATSNLPSTGVITSPNTVLLFGLASYAPWSTPNEVEFRVYMDTNLDGAPDYVVVNTSIGSFSNTLSDDRSGAGLANDVFITPLYRVQLPGAPTYAGQLSFWNTLPGPLSTLNSAQLDAAPFNTRVMFQAVRASTIGLSPAQTRVRYYVEARARDANGFATVVDRVPATGAIEYDIAHAAVTPVNTSDPLLVQRPLFAAVQGGQVSGALDQSVLAERGRQSLLLLYHHNAPATQVQVVRVQSSSPLGLRSAPEFVRAVLPMVSR